MTFIKNNLPVILITLAVIIAGSYFSFAYMQQPLIGTDDANILFVYARNFINGNGIVYNVGGEHVEGFTCLLYFLICSVCYLISPNPEVLIFIVNLFLAIGSSALLLHTISIITRKFGLKATHSVFLQLGLLLWLISNPLYFAWNIVSLMDSGLYSFIIIATLSFFIHLCLNETINDKRMSIVLSTLIIAIILTRPEGIIWCILFISLYTFIYYQKNKTFNQLVALLVWPIIAYVGSFLLLTLFRIFYFGYPLPNTFYAKVSASITQTIGDGFQYFWNFLHVYGFQLLPFLAFSIFWMGYQFIKGNLNDRFLLGLIILLFNITGIVIPVLEGADHFRGFRMYQPIYPLLYFIYINPIFIVYKKISYTYIKLYAGILSIAIFIFTFFNWNDFKNSQSFAYVPANYQFSIFNEFYIAANERENGRHIALIFEQYLPAIGYGSAGGIAYGYKGKVYDMMGLNNTQMAHADAIKEGPKGHESFNKKVFYQLAPDIIMPQTPAPSNLNLQNVNNYYTDRNSWDNLIFKDIFNDAVFKEKYELAAVINLNYPEYCCVGYYRKDYLHQLLELANFKILKQ
ncbi:hypothetical protein [Hydrotalea sp.]|uniref:hypothetical protein n=1 Tax=Hydrotalea sp. TaxID=2881279 RepID=UPI002627E55B|nr:hypothetical protein [Hydrotalea sp.]